MNLDGKIRVSVNLCNCKRDLAQPITGVAARHLEIEKTVKSLQISRTVVISSTAVLGLTTWRAGDDRVMGKDYVLKLTGIDR